MEISYKNIKKIDNNKIIITINQNNSFEIDFLKLLYKQANHVNSSPDFQINNLDIANSICISERNICSKPKYFLLYSDTPVKIIFDNKPNFLENIINRGSSPN